MDRNRRRKFGQNFLNNPGIIGAIVSDLPYKAGGSILEIGPGHGALTSLFIEGKADLNCVEIDENCVEQLINKFGENCPQIFNEDFLDFDLESYLKEKKNPPWIVGNLPYNMATPIISKILPLLDQTKGLMIMVQLEAGQRLMAEPGTKDYGFLSVQRACYASAKILRKVGPENFNPKPNVMSATLLIESLPKEELLNPAMLDDLVGPAFRHRRKKITNNLKDLFDKELVLESIKEMGLSETIRGEALTAVQFAELYSKLTK
jgi:16S rRNA (adenine1518-N6/adenine1519-N6)-dimethyltransferase